MSNSSSSSSSSRPRSPIHYSPASPRPRRHSPHSPSLFSEYPSNTPEIDNIDPESIHVYIDASFSRSDAVCASSLYSPVFVTPISSPLYTPCLRPQQPPSLNSLNTSIKKTMERVENYNEVTLAQMLDRTLFFSVIFDQAGSRALQQKLASASREELSRAYSLLKNSLLKVSTNIFANYIVQKVLTMAPEFTEDAKDELAGHFATLSKDTCGCRVVQAVLSLDPALKRADVLEQTNSFSFSALGRSGGKKKLPLKFKAIYDEIKGALVDFVVDINGNHVVQKLVDSQNAEIIADILEKLERHFSMLVKDIYGCRVLQKLVDVSSLVLCGLKLRLKREKRGIEAEEVDEGKVTQLMVRLNKHNNNFFGVLSRNVKGYIRNQHSNYVMQSSIKFISFMFDQGQVLDANRVLLLEQLTNTLVLSFCELATHKYASNVVETCLEMIPVEFKRRIIILLENEANLKVLIRDPFGNYVIQTALKNCDNENRKKFICRKLRSMIVGQKNNNNHEKFILEFISKIDK